MKPFTEVLRMTQMKTFQMSRRITASLVIPGNSALGFKIVGLDQSSKTQAFLSIIYWPLD